MGDYFWPVLALALVFLVALGVQFLGRIARVVVDEHEGRKRLGIDPRDVL